MKYIVVFCGLVLHMNVAQSQSPCGKDPQFRMFDFWLGTWEAFGVNGKKAGDSKISIILDSCVILEEWTSAGKMGNFKYAGKSFNTFNRSSGQWQQTWVDNTGSATEYTEAITSPGQIIFKTRPFKITSDTMAIRRLTFKRLSDDKVRQHGEISRDNGSGWTTEYDLEYRRIKH